MHLVRSGALIGFNSLVRRYGENPVLLIREAGLSEAQFRNPDTYISYPKMALLLEMAAAKCGAPLFGLILAEQNFSDVLGGLPTAVSQESSVSLALEKLSQHIYLVAKGVGIELVDMGGNTELRMGFDFESLMGKQQLLQLSVAHLANITARFMGANRFSLPLCLRQSAPKHANIQGSIFYKNTIFSSSFDGLLVGSASLGMRPVSGELVLQEHLHERLKALQAQHPRTLRSQVRVLIAQLLSTSECGVEAIASSLDLHPRILQARLKREGTSYTELLKEARQAIAEESLLNPDVAITDLALHLGFADVAVFSRSFKRWVGLSPRAWRRKFVE